jgi:hypothetical protein
VTGVAALTQDTEANRPAASTTGRIYVASDTRAIYRDTGSAWELVGTAPANLSAGDVGLGNVPNTDATNASNIDSGTLPSGRLSGSYSIDISGDADTLDGTEGTNYARTDQSETFSNGVTIQGDLAVEGTTFTVEPQTVQITDNLLLLNKGEVGTGISEGTVGLEADRGDGEPIKLIYEESSQALRVGVKYQTIAYSGLTGTFEYNEEIVGQSSGANAIVRNDTGSALQLKGRNGTFTAGETVQGQASGATATADSITTTDQTQPAATREDSPEDTGVPFWNSTRNRLDTSNDLEFDGTDLLVGQSAVWHAGNDGPGSGLDADKLDGNQASAFLQSLSGSLDGVLDANGNDLEDGTTTIWDASAGYIPSGRVDGVDSHISSTTNPHSVTASQVGLGSVENIALSTAGWADIGISQSDISKTNVGLGNLNNDAQVVNAGSTPSIEANTSSNRPAPSTAGRLYIETDNSEIYRDTGSSWVAIGGGGGSLTELSDVSSAAQTDGNVLASSGSSYGSEGISTLVSDHVGKSDVGLSNVPNTDIAYSSTIPADAFTSAEVTNLRNGQLEDGTTPWTANNYFDGADARTAVEGTSDVADLASGLTNNSGYVPISNGTGGVSWDNPESHVHSKYTDADAQGAVSASDVGLGSVENVALSAAGWTDIGIDQSDVTKSNVGLGSVPNTNIAYASTIPADAFTSTEVSNLRSGKLDDGTTPWTSNNYFDGADARTAVEGTSDVADLISGATTNSGYVPTSDGTGGVSWDDPETHVHAKYTDTDAQSAVTASDVGLGSVENVALSTAGWADIGISQSDVSKSNVSLGSVTNDPQVVDAGSTPSIQTGTETNRPTAGTTGRLFVASDTQTIYRDTGTTWNKIALNPGNIQAADLGFDPATQTELNGHTSDTTNPHSVTASQVGLGSVENKALSNAGWADLGISTSDVTASDVSLGNVDNKALSNVGWTDLAISKTDVSKSNVGLGSVENKALSNASWTDLAISTSDVSASDVSLGSLSNDEQVVDAGSVPSIQADTNTNRPTAGTAGRLYVETDTGKVLRDDGTGWKLYGQRPSTLGWADLAISTSDISRSDINLGSAGWSDLGISQSDVSKSNVGLGSVPNTDFESGFTTSGQITMTTGSPLQFNALASSGNKAYFHGADGSGDDIVEIIRDGNNDYRWNFPGGVEVGGSKMDWADLGISRSDVSKSDVGLGNVPNSNIAYSSTIAADAFTSTEISNLRSGQLDDGTTPWTSNNYFDAANARSAVEGTSDVTDLVSGQTANANYVPVSNGSGGVSWDDPETHVHNKYTDSDAQGAVSASDVGLGSVENKALSNASWADLSISQSDVSASDVGLGRVANASMNVVDTEPSSGSGQDGDVWFVV